MEDLTPFDPLTDLRVRFDEVLATIESVAGWQTARVQRPVLILGSLDGIETGVRQLIRAEPLETMVVEHEGATITLPTEAEVLRIKGVLILRRNATRDYLDFVALAEYRRLVPKWHDWVAVKAACAHVATTIFDRVCEMDAPGYGSSGR